MKSNLRPTINCLDLEGVLVPEIWIAVAKATKIADLGLTTRDIPNYHVLMRHRLKILNQNKIYIRDIQKVISGMSPLPGARSFLKRLRAMSQVIILSDTYYEFAEPLMRQLEMPSLLCNYLSVNSRGLISNYHIRQPNGKAQAVRAFKRLGFCVRAAGDSYNDLTMLRAANKGVFFKPPRSISEANPRFPVTKSYTALFRALTGK